MRRFNGRRNKGFDLEAVTGTTICALCPFTSNHSAYIGRVIKSRRLRLAGHVVRMEEGRSPFKIDNYTYRKETFRKA